MFESSIKPPNKEISGRLEQLCGLFLSMHWDGYTSFLSRRQPSLCVMHAIAQMCLCDANLYHTHFLDPQDWILQLLFLLELGLESLAVRRSPVHRVSPCAGMAKHHSTRGANLACASHMP
ncbi:hypothetical protein HAX54_048291 [Datura stramonium]|uniref:Uncharacterized protein n=1 Tax=Datura stramonium TaxID=4076 RepID=A0ABS8WMW9_DATST|nr:hypothetical protein [Datura stramonium]